MANKVRFDYSKASKFINAHEVEYMSELAVAAREKLVSKSGAGNDFLGWIDLPVDYDKEEFARIHAHEVEYMSELAVAAREKLVSKSGAGNDFLGWIDLPVDYDKEEFARIQKAAAKIQSDSEVLLVIGIGGSYLGARAANEFLGHSFYNVISKEMRKTPEIYYVGNSISSDRNRWFLPWSKSCK